jgi:hypothetical protein
MRAYDGAFDRAAGDSYSAIWLLGIKRNADLNREVDAHSTCVSMPTFA